MGNGTFGKGPPVQRPHVLVRSWAQELRGTGAEARGCGACLGSAPRTPPACEPGEQGPGTVCVCGRALAAQLEDSGVRRGELAASGARGASTPDTPGWGRRGSCPGTDGHRAVGRSRAAAGVLLPEEAGTPVTRSSPCRDLRSLRLPKPAPGQDVAALTQRDAACPVSLAPVQAAAPRGYTVSPGAL